MNSLTHYWWLRIVLFLRVSPVCDCRHRVLVADQGGQQNDDLWLHQYYFSNLMDDWKPFLASGKFYVSWKRMYALSLYRYDVCIYSGNRGKNWDFCPRELAIFGIHCIFHHSFCFLGANYCNIFYDCSSFGRGFAHGGEFPLSFLKVVGLGHGVENCCWPVTVVTVL